MEKKKLFLIHNHKNFSGAARSLGETITNLKNRLEFILICPKGSASKFFKSLNIRVIEANFVPRFNHFELGYYRGLRWLLLIREAFVFFYFFLFLLILKLEFKNINKVHLNEIELIVIAPIIKLLFNSSITSHIRSPLELKKGKFRYNFIKYLCKKYLSNIISIDQDCYKTSPVKSITKIIYNGINKKNLSNINGKKKNITFGFIGNFIKRKGIYETLKVFQKIPKKFNTKLVCVGKTNKTNNLLNLLKFEENFEDFCKKNSIKKNRNIKILPMTFNLKSFYSSIDVILFPGYMNAVGRPVIEASLLKKPSIIALKNYNNDTAMKKNCLIFKPGDLTSFENRILYFLKNKSKIKIMGINAYKNAKKKFDINRNSIKFYNLIF